MIATTYLPLVALVLVPILGGLLVAVLPRNNPALAKQVTMGISLLVLVLGIVVGLAYEPGATGTFQLGSSWEWIPAWGVRFALGVDGISLVLILMTVVLVPVCILAGWTDADDAVGSVRSYFAWILILRNGGSLDWVVQTLGLTQQPLNILYTPLAVGIGLTYSFLPFMILPAYVALERIDRRLIEAAFDLGADRWRTLRRVVLPLAMPGIVAGAVLVFVPCLGAYVSPELLGGGKSLMIGNLVQAQFGESRNWPFGAALALVLVLFLLLALALLALIKRRSALRLS